MASTFRVCVNINPSLPSNKKKRLVGSSRCMISGTLNLRPSTLWQNTRAVSALKKERNISCKVFSFCVFRSILHSFTKFDHSRWVFSFVFLMKHAMYCILKTGYDNKTNISSPPWMTNCRHSSCTTTQLQCIFSLGRTQKHPCWPLIALWSRWYTVKLSCTEKWKVKEQEESVVITLHPVQTRGSLVFNEPWASVCTAHESEELWDR